MLFDPVLPPPRDGLGRWLRRLCLIVFVAIGLAAALLLFAPLL